MGTMCCLQEDGNTELLPSQEEQRVTASLKFPAHASRGARRGTELGRAWALFSLYRVPVRDAHLREDRIDRWTWLG